MFSDEVELSKPAAAIFERALDEFGVAADAAVAARERLHPGAPDRAGQVVLDMAEPVGRAHQRRPVAVLQLEVLQPLVPDEQRQQLLGMPNVVQRLRMVNVWTPLVPARVENGCMQFVPGSHQQDVLPHHPIGNDPRVIGLEVDEPEAYAARAAACPIPAA